jgi:LuxR family transcriptional regulator, maltose regulon positive regulatory protein
MGSAYPSIRTKIRTPRRHPDLVRRQRLVDFIHGAIQHKLILIAAGAGYGKTSLLIDYAYDTDLPVCWYSLDAHDAQVSTFVEYLVAAIRERFPQFGGPVLQALATYQGDEADVEPFVRLLIREIEEQIHQYFVLILDDYHTILDSEGVNALLDGLLLYLPEQCHIILATRGIPRRLTLSRLAAQRQVVGQSAHELAFTQDEICVLLANLGLGDLDAASVQRLAERSEGWVTGIILAAQTDPGATQEMMRLSGASGGVFDYMAEEVLSRQRQEIQDFALRSALCTEMSPPLCDALLSIENSAQLLRELSEQNLFTATLDNEGNWYQYHQLFREFLLARFERGAPGEYRQLQMRLAALMAERGRWGQAIDSYLAAGAFADAARGIELVAQETFERGAWDRLQAWIDELPPAILSGHPRLLLYRGKLHAERGELGRAMVLCQRSEEAFARRGDEVGAARALAQQAVIERFRGRLTEAILLCRRVLDGQAQAQKHQDPIAATLAQHNIGICYTMQGRVAEGIAQLHEALLLARRHADDMSAGYIAHDIGLAELNRGHLTAGRQSLHQALMIWRRVGNPSALAISLQGLGIIHHYLGEYIEAENRLQESLAKALDAGDQRVAAYTIVSQADLYRDMGRFAEADETYQRGLTVATASGAAHLAVYSLASRGYAQRFMGQALLARQLIIEALDNVSREMPLEQGLCHLYLGALAVDAQAYEEGREHLKIAIEILERIEAKRDLARALLHLARLEWLGKEARVVERLRRVADLAEELGSSQFITAEALPVGGERSMLEMLLQAREPHITQLARMALRDLAKWISMPAHGDGPNVGGTTGDETIGGSSIAPVPVATISLPRSAKPLEFLGLDGGQVFKEGSPVQDWESMVARIMVFLFLSHPRGLRRERAIDLLWPEVSEARGNSLFHSTLYRVRNALYKDVVVHQPGSMYRINPQREYRYDVDEFQRLARLGLGQDEASSENMQAMARARALALYQRPFLETCEYDWCDQIRRSLENALLDVLYAQARYIALHGAPDDAEALYTRALHINPFDERAHRGIMWSRSVRGDRSGALRQFQDCKEILADEMGIDPEAETIDLYVHLLEGSASMPPPL